MAKINCYAGLKTIKSRLEIPQDDSKYNADLLAILEAASRAVDKYTHRFFYAKHATRYYDGDTAILITDDILSITSLKLDLDADGAYEITMASSDYVQYPLNEFPSKWLEIANGGDYSGFGSGVRKAVEITGVFGFGDEESATPYDDSDQNLQNTGGINATETGIEVEEGADFQAGQTIGIITDDVIEQMYIKEVNGETLKVKRGVNGTTAAVHAEAADIYIYDYAGLIKEACLIQAFRWWERKNTGFQDAVGSPETGLVNMYKGLDPDIKLMLKDYVRTVTASGRANV